MTLTSYSIGRVGEQFIGRILASLNIHQHTFAVLPPQFGVWGAAHGVSFCCYFVVVLLLFCCCCVPFYLYALSNSPIRIAILYEAGTRLIERVFPIGPGTHCPMSGVLLKCTVVFCLLYIFVIEVVTGASGQGFTPGYNYLFRCPLGPEA
jgi:hypothetical protein